MGLYKFRKELLDNLISQENEISISLPYDEEYVPKLIEMGCKYIDTPIERRGINPFSDFLLLMKYIKIIKKITPDVVLTYTIKPNIYGGLACRLTNVPYLANITGLGSALGNGGVVQKIGLFMYKISLIKASCVFVQNEENMRFLIEKKIVKDKARLLPGSGVNVEYYRSLEYPSEETINFLYISRIMKEKGIEQYLNAAMYIRKNYKNTSFHVIGFCEEDYEHTLNKLHDEGIIVYHGKQSDIREYIKKAHCTIHPSYYAEGMSNVLLESAASGRPLITTNRPGCREVVDHGVNGFIHEPENTEDLINKIKEFLALDHETKKQMGVASRKKVEEQFDRKIVIEAYFDEINKLINKNREDYR